MAADFHRLSPFLQDYIYRHGWQDLRGVQRAAMEVLFDTNAHLLLSAGTASGKTEAAFLPALTLLEENPSDSVGILYISPLKALINDQFYRLDDLLAESGIPVTKWHGDVSQSQKSRLIKHPQGVLQITPESLEGMLMHRKAAIPKLFGDLRFIIIDEVHYFMGSRRGVQLLSLLQRVQRLADVNPRRIGLSATLGDTSLGEAWLASGTDRKVITPHFAPGGQKLRLAAEHFTLMHPEMKDGELSQNDLAYFKFLMDQTYGKRCILFGNVKMELERVIATLKELCALEKKEDLYLIHHGNLSASLRENTELVMKQGDLPITTGATVTLELGIDLGTLERIVQLGAPFSVSSFVQRLGRSGRRGEPAEMVFAFAEYQHETDEQLLQQVDWGFLSGIAILQLYLEDQFVEPILSPKKPFALLYHQTMSVLAGMGEATPAQLASQLLTLEVFKHVTPDEYRILLRHMVKLGHIQPSETGGLYVGLNAEGLIGDYHFLSVFEAPACWAVCRESEEIGSVLVKFPVGERFALAGQTWEVVDVDEKARRLQVVPVSGRSSNLWDGKGFMIHTRILQKMRQIIAEDDVYAYLMPGAAKTLHQIRATARKAGLTDHTVLPIGSLCHETGHRTRNPITGQHKTLGNGDYAIFPWLGTRSFVTLEIALAKAGLTVVAKAPPYWLVVRTEQGIDFVYEALRHFQMGEYDGQVGYKAQDLEEKYEEYLPEELKAIEFNVDFLDWQEAKEQLFLK